MKRILLMGSPNIGKSAFFSRLTGVHVVTSNYPGTTVGYSKGYVKLGDETAEVIDVPGTYTLEPLSKAEEVATEMLAEGDVVIDIVDSTNMERNLFLTLQLMEKGIPMIIALNLWDEARHKGIKIDIKKLESLLGVPVVPTVAVTGEGMKELTGRLAEAVAVESPHRSHDELWAEVGRIVEQIQTVSHRHHTLLERLGDASIRPFPGIPIAIAVLVGSFALIRLIGQGLIDYVFGPLFNNLWAPVMIRLSDALGGSGFVHDVFVGELVEGAIDFEQSFGILTTGLYIPFGIVLPYVFAFYLVLGFLEDFGYLPRVAVLMDTIMHRIGVHGFAIIPTLLGFGCNVPGILATRILESKRERFIVATLISIAVPCAALQAMIIGLVGSYGLQYVVVVYATLFIVWLLLGLILRFTVKGFTPELLIEIPPYRLPPLRALGTKLWMRMKHFVKEAVPIVMLGILAVTLLYAVGVFGYIADFFSPVVTGLFGLPEDATAAIAIGFLRKDMAVGMLGALNLTAGQLVVGSVVLAMFFPCIATFVILFKELGLRRLLASTGIMIAIVFAAGSILNLIMT
ncbi:FeoB small GTPase domain-containing protein [Chloroflexota bacterium]